MVLIRHLHLTRSLIGLIIGITWIVLGLRIRVLVTESSDSFRAVRTISAFPLAGTASRPWVGRRAGQVICERIRR